MARDHRCLPASQRPDGGNPYQPCKDCSPFRAGRSPRSLSGCQAPAVPAGPAGPRGPCRAGGPRLGASRFRGTARPSIRLEALRSRETARPSVRLAAPHCGIVDQTASPPAPLTLLGIRAGVLFGQQSRARMVRSWGRSFP